MPLLADIVGLQRCRLSARKSVRKGLTLMARVDEVADGIYRVCSV